MTNPICHGILAYRAHSACNKSNGVNIIEMALHSWYTKYKPTTNGYNDIQVAIMKRAASPQWQTRSLSSLPGEHHWSRPPSMAHIARIRWLTTGREVTLGIWLTNTCQKSLQLLPHVFLESECQIQKLILGKCNTWRYGVALVPHYAPSKQESRRFQVYSCDVVGKGYLCKY